MSASWIEKLTQSDSRLHKEDVLSQALTMAKLGDKEAHCFLELTKATYNPFITFGVKQVENTVGITDAENPLGDYINLLAKLSTRSLTGHAARDAIQEISGKFDSVEWNTFLAPVLRRDLRAGISEKTVNKICKKTDYEIPVFGCQLATSSEGRPEMRGVKRLEPKLDGVRVLMMVVPSDNSDGVTVTSYSRNGKVFENFTHIEEQVKSNFNKLIKNSTTALIYGFVLDGEIVGQSFNELMKQARRKENVQATDSVFNVFDIIPIADFRRGYWNTQLHKRIDILNKMLPTISEMPNVELLTYIMVNLDTAEGLDQLNRYANDMVVAGFEGIMIKHPDAPYECKRNTDWLKWKPVITVDLKVIDIEEGTGRNIGRLGAIVCEGVDGGKTINVNCGSGFSDEQRDDIWVNRNIVVGQTVEILADAVSQNQDGTYSLRFPRFVRFRDDK